MGELAPLTVHSAHRFDEQRLSAYLQDKIPGFGMEIAVHQFEGGQSNPTYRIDTPAGAYVLRKKPAGELLPSAHAVDREFAFMQALQGTVPVPHMLHLCMDDSVTGQAFYVMEHVVGRLMSDARLLAATPAERHPLSLELMRVLARLHRADYRALGLERFGRTGSYAARQLSRWTRQYAASRMEDNADMDHVIAWLEQRLPQDDETAIVHGDYRSHNVLFAPDSPAIVAVLDWELATIGHPIADVAYCLLPYHLPADDPRGFHGADPGELGIPSEQEMIAAYCEVAGRSDLPHWQYFLVFSLFRSAAIRAGVYKRAHDGTAASTQALEAGSRYRVAATTAWRLAQVKV